MSLRDELAARLAFVVKDIDGIVGLADYEEACELARADECIRQMEWTRGKYGYCEKCGAAVELDRGRDGDSWGITPPPDGTGRRSGWDERCSSGGIHSAPYPLPVTLAPDDWKP